VNRKIAFVVVVVALAAAGVVLASQILSNRDADAKDALIAPYKDAANTFPVPPGAAPSMPDTPTTEKRGIVKGWTSTGTVDDACTVWRDAYRNWVGVTGAQTIAGEYSPGQSCSYTSPKGSFTAKLAVAIYADPRPQVTLTVTE